jgi:hypothetical protein
MAHPSSSGSSSGSSTIQFRCHDFYVLIGEIKRSGAPYEFFVHSSYNLSIVFPISVAIGRGFIFHLFCRSAVEHLPDITPTADLEATVRL